MDHRPLGRTGLNVSPIGFGAFKIGRNSGIKYPKDYPLPDRRQVAALLNGLLEMGINFIDTAPAYGDSETLIGQTIARRREEYVLCTKVGETFENGRSVYDYSTPAVNQSIERSLKRLQTDHLDLLLIHASGNDLDILHHTDVVDIVLELRRRGMVHAIGVSGKTPEGAANALTWADVIMVEYHLRDQSHEAVITQAARKGVGVLCKKGLASGHLSPHEAIPFVLANPHIASLVIGGLSLSHFHHNVQLAAIRSPQYIISC